MLTNSGLGCPTDRCQVLEQQKHQAEDKMMALEQDVMALDPLCQIHLVEPHILACIYLYHLYCTHINKQIYIRITTYTYIHTYIYIHVIFQRHLKWCIHIYMCIYIYIYIIVFQKEHRLPGHRCCSHVLRRYEEHTALLRRLAEVQGAGHQ